MASQTQNAPDLERPRARSEKVVRAQKLLAVGGVLGALAASSCCIVPLALFGLGISGAWIANLTQLAPYQAYFIAGTAACLGFGSWLRYRSMKTACSDGEVCDLPLPSRIVTIGLFVATVLVIGALALDFFAPFFLWLKGERDMIKSVMLFGLGLLASSAALAGEKTLTLTIENMYGSACPIIVKSSHEAVPGVVKAVVSYADKTAVVTFDDAKTVVPALINATTNAGYPSAPKS